MASRAVKLRWYLGSSVNEMCYKSCAVTYRAQATRSIDLHSEDQRDFPRTGHFISILKCL